MNYIKVKIQMRIESKNCGQTTVSTYKVTWISVTDEENRNNIEQ